MVSNFGNLQNYEKHSTFQEKIYDQLYEFQQKDKMNPRNNQQDRQEFPKQFSWEHTALQTEQVHQIEKFSV